MKKENKNGIIVTDLYDGKMLKCRFDITESGMCGKSMRTITFSVSHMDERFRNTHQNYEAYGVMCYVASNGFKVRSETHPQIACNSEVYLRGHATQMDDDAFSMQTKWSVLECRKHILKCIEALKEWERNWVGFKEEKVKSEMSLKEVKGEKMFNCVGCGCGVNLDNRGRNYGFCNVCSEKKQQKSSKSKKSNILLLMKEIRKYTESLNQYEVQVRELYTKVNDTIGKIRELKDEAKQIIEGIK